MRDVSRNSFRNMFLVSLNSRVNSNGPGMRNTFAIERERKRQLAAFPGTIHPYSDFRWYWDILMTVVLIGALIVQPVQIAFYSSTEQDLNFGTVVGSTAVALVFFIDIFLNFRTGIDDCHSDMVILERKEIARLYLKSWCVIDILSSFPFNTLYYIVVQAIEVQEDDHFYYKVIRLLGLLRVFRLSRVIQALNRIEKAFRIPELRVRLINLLVMISTIFHWLTCWHWLVCDLFNPPGQRKEFSWISRLNLWDRPNWIKYTNAALRALSNMGCLGYGGLAGEAPTEPEDIIATMISIVIGATCFALYIGTLGSILQSMDTSESKFGDVILEVNEYMKFRNIPKDLQHRVRTYYEQRYRRHYFNEAMILDSISDVLRTEIQMSNCQHLVENVSLFQSLPINFLKKIVSKLKFEVFIPGDVIIDAGSAGEAMHFIQEGVVSVNSKEGAQIATLQSGDYFGEVALLNKEHKTITTVVAQDYCDMYRLERSDFYAVFDGYPEILAKIKMVAQQRNEETNRKTSDINKPCNSSNELVMNLNNF